jgi:hypothetical protein
VEAPIITTPKNISILSKGQVQFKLVKGDNATTYSITANSIVGRAAKFTIGEKSILMRIGETKSMVLGTSTLFITLADIQDSTAIVTLSTTPITVSKLANGVGCSSNSQCQSNYCNNNFCCDAGTCCLITNDCPEGQRCVGNICITPGAQTCSDGTLYGNCSTNKPKYCSTNGSLVDSCLICGCPAAKNCNSTTNACYTPPQPPAQPLYSPEKAEELANKTNEGSLMLRFGALFQTAKGCAGANPAKLACLPTLGVTTTLLSEGLYKTAYSYSFNSSCCSSNDVLRITCNLTSNSTSSSWVIAGIDESSLITINSSLRSNCAGAVNLLACR